MYQIKETRELTEAEAKEICGEDVFLDSVAVYHEYRPGDYPTVWEVIRNTSWKTWLVGLVEFLVFLAAITMICLGFIGCSVLL